MRPTEDKIMNRIQLIRVNNTSRRSQADHICRVYVVRVNHYLNFVFR